MNKSISTLRIVASAFVLSMASSAVASDLLIDGLYYNLDSINGTAEVTYKGSCRCGGNVYTGEVTIPSQIAYGANTYVVSAIGDYAFAGNSKLTAVSIPETVTRIGKLAFFACVNMQRVTIPASVDEIDGFAFQFCSRLAEVNFEEGSQLKVINEYAFCRTALAYLSIPESANEICPVAFCHNKNMTDLVLPKNITKISVQNPFCYNTQLVTMRAEEGNPSFDSRDNCNALIQTATNTLIAGCKTTVIPNTVKALGRSSFNNCTDLDSIFIPASVDSIGKYAFYTCTGLKKFTFPSSMKVMADSTFWKATNLEEVISLTAKPFKIDESDFEDITYNTAVLKVAPGTKKLYQTATGWRKFAQIVELDMFVKDGVYYRVIDEGKAEVIAPQEGIAYAGNVVIPASVKSGDNSYAVTAIADDAFAGSNVKQVSMPKGVKANLGNVKVVVRNTYSKGNDFESANVKVYGQKGYIAIEGSDAEAKVYNTAGVMILTTLKRSIPIEQGIYIVKVGDNEATKVVVE